MCGNFRVLQFIREQINQSDLTGVASESPNCRPAACFTNSVAAVVGVVCCSHCEWFGCRTNSNRGWTIGRVVHFASGKQPVDR